MSRYYSQFVTNIILIFVFNLTIVSTSVLKDKLISKSNGTSSNVIHRISIQTDKLRNITSSLHDRLRPSHGWEDSDYNDKAGENENEQDSTQYRPANIVVLTSLSGIYIWWPTLFGGDDSFHLLLSQEDVPRFHDVIADDNGNIYLTAPHERTVYRLQYSDGWWISNFSNHSLMNSIRSEMPLFLNIHRISSILYVYGHSDIQMIDLLERPRTRGSAPFMKRLRELSPNLRISDLIIDQLTSDGYVIGDSYGWCIVIRCSLSVNECTFLFKIPSSYDNRPYPCTATIDFSTKIMYLSLEEKILAIHLNEQTNFDRRQVFTEKNGPRSTLGYDDIITFNNTILYTDVLRPILHICTPTHTNPCLNLSLTFPSPQRTILPLRLAMIKVHDFHPPFEADDDTDLHIGEAGSHLSPSAIHASNTTSTSEHQISGLTTAKPHELQRVTIYHLFMLIIGIFLGLIIGGISFIVYSIIYNKNGMKYKSKQRLSTDTAALIDRLVSEHNPINDKIEESITGSKAKSSAQSSSGSSNAQSTDTTAYSSSGSSEFTGFTSSLSYQPDIIL